MAAHTLASVRMTAMKTHTWEPLRDFARDGEVARVRARYGGGRHDHAVSRGDAGGTRSGPRVANTADDGDGDERGRRRWMGGYDQALERGTRAANSTK